MILIKIILESLLDSYNKGKCKELSEKEENELLETLIKFKDKFEYKQDETLSTEEASIYHRGTGPLHSKDGRYLHPVGGQPRTGAQTLGFAGKGGPDRTAQNQRQGCQEDFVTRQIVPG